MTKKNNKISQILDDKEKPFKTYGWSPEEGSDYLKAIEDDVRDLMLRLAEAEFTLSQEKHKEQEKTKKLLLSLLEILDAFERIFDNIASKKDQVKGKSKIWINNFQTVYRLLGKILSGQDVKPIENLDKVFDPHWHKPIEVVENVSLPEGTIMEEYKKGYTWKEQILRKAEVVVTRNEIKE